MRRKLPFSPISVCGGGSSSSSSCPGAEDRHRSSRTTSWPPPWSHGGCGRRGRWRACGGRHAHHGDRGRRRSPYRKYQ
ncbi:60S ribosomal protein L11 [Angomonas deanei]|nr:60S ribosomal protein L11 [Angomonas deanei]|eukprot:EPY40005.1 60S ribosomal protein L11 [Angomonas deanei]